jgi:hypothetical protein
MIAFDPSLRGARGVKQMGGIEKIDFAAAR